jgi:hypothetical protein
LRGVKKEQFVKVDTGGNLKHVTREVLGTTDVSTDYNLRLAFQRRNLAFDQLDLLPYEAGEKYINMLFDLTNQPVPSTHSSVTMEQVVISDKHVWLKICEVCRTGVARKGASYPIEDALRIALADPIVMSSLQPLPKARGASQSDSYQKTRPFPYDDTRNYNQSVADKGKGKGKKGKGKGKYGKANRGTQGFTVPNELKGGSSRNNDGVPVCFNYNLRGCQGAKPGARCQKGLHVCAKCFSSDHVFGQCNKN